MAERLRVITPEQGDARYATPQGVAASQLHFSAPSAVLRGPGIDNTGVAVSTSAVKALIAGLTSFGVRQIQVAAGDVINLDDTITLEGSTRVIGPGELRWTAGIANKPGLSLEGDDITVEGVKLSNPNSLKSTSGGRNYGISVHGNNIRINGNLIDHFENGIAVRMSGEYHNIQILNNRVKDVTGSALEDRGDGIIVWGAQATITGNIVNALDGSDCRVGIHMESTGITPAVVAPHTTAMGTITGNVVYGKFRRSIVSENIEHATIMGNSVADATWWAIALIKKAHHSIVSGNTIRWTRTTSDNQGSQWAPIRAPIMLRGSVDHAMVVNNAIEVMPGSDAAAYIIVQASEAADQPSFCTISGNIGSNSGGTVGTGIRSDTLSTSLHIQHNRISGFSGRGIWLFGSDEFIVTDNELLGIPGVSTYGVSAPQTSTKFCRIARNVIHDCTRGIERANGFGGDYSENHIVNAVYGIDLFGTTGSAQVVRNSFENVTTHIRNSSSLFFYEGNDSIAASVAIDPPAIATGASYSSGAITALGARLGDYVQVAAPYDLQGIQVTAYVSAADSIKLQMVNLTGASINLPSGLWKVRVVGR